MKEKTIILTVFVIIPMCFALITGCTANEYARNYGGDITIELPANEKLEEITWKDDNLWYLTRPMRDSEEAETHVFQQDSPFGIIEGSVTIIESKEE